MTNEVHLVNKGSKQHSKDDLNADNDDLVRVWIADNNDHMEPAAGGMLSSPPMNVDLELESWAIENMQPQDGADRVMRSSNKNKQ